MRFFHYDVCGHPSSERTVSEKDCATTKAGRELSFCVASHIGRAGSAERPSSSRARRGRGCNGARRGATGCNGSEERNEGEVRPKCAAKNGECRVSTGPRCVKRVGLATARGRSPAHTIRGRTLPRRYACRRVVSPLTRSRRRSPPSRRRGVSAGGSRRRGAERLRRRRGEGARAPGAHTRPGAGRGRRAGARLAPRGGRGAAQERRGRGRGRGRGRRRPRGRRRRPSCVRRRWRSTARRTSSVSGHARSAMSATRQPGCPERRWRRRSRTPRRHLAATPGTALPPYYERGLANFQRTVVERALPQTPRAAVENFEVDRRRNSGIRPNLPRNVQKIDAKQLTKIMQQIQIRDPSIALFCKTLCDAFLRIVISQNLRNVTIQLLSRLDTTNEPSRIHRDGLRDV